MLLVKNLPNLWQRGLEKPRMLHQDKTIKCSTDFTVCKQLLDNGNDAPRNR